jgi:hypothetical protein
MRGKRLAQSFCVLTLLCGSIFAQTTSATLQGTVTDPGDAAVPGTTIELKNTSTGAVRSTTSTGEGIFRFNSIEPAVYNLTVKAGSGFKALELNDINVNAAEVRELGRLKLALGALTEAVEVTAVTTPGANGFERELQPCGCHAGCGSHPPGAGYVRRVADCSRG